MNDAADERQQVSGSLVKLRYQIPASTNPCGEIPLGNPQPINCSWVQIGIMNMCRKQLLTDSEIKEIEEAFNVKA